MSKKNPVIQQTICWVPTCVNQYVFDKKYYPLPPVKSKLREIWLALATKPTKDVNLEQIFFCEDHFEVITEDMVINNVLFKHNEPNILIPNKNMPDRVCRTCNHFVHNKEPLYIMSSSNNSYIPANIPVELKNAVVTFNPEPLHHIFTFCFKEFAIPIDPVPLLCGKCHYFLWLYFAFKKRAIEVEDFLGKDMTPEEYGRRLLCRTCPDACSNFFPLGRDSDLGIILQKLFDNNYSPDVVPLRVCLNCYNVLQKISSFYKTCVSTDEIIKRRAILNAKLKTVPAVSNARSPAGSPSNRQSFSKKVEKENLVLANLMIQFGQALRVDLHNIENWNPICIKLQEQGINYKVPSLITNWRKMSNIMQDKIRNRIPLSDLEKLVWQFYNPISNGNATLESASSPQISPSKTFRHDHLLNRPGLMVYPIDESSPSSSGRGDKHNRNTELLQNRGVICWNASPSTSATSDTIVLDDEPNKQKKSDPKAVKNDDRSVANRKLDTEKHAKYPIEMQRLFLRVIDEEFRDFLKLRNEKKLNLENKNPWQLLLETVAFKGKFSKDLADVHRMWQYMCVKPLSVVEKQFDPQIAQEVLRLKQEIPKLVEPFISAPKISPTPLSDKEKLELIDVMTKYKSKKGLQSDISAFCDIWPEVMQMLRERGCKRDLENIKETWHEMKQSTQKALAENKLTDEVHKLLAAFLFPAKNEEQAESVQSAKKATALTTKESSKGPQAAKKSNTGENSKVQKKSTKKPTGSTTPGGRKAVIFPVTNKSATSTNLKKHPGRPSSTTFEEKMLFAKALSCEFDKLTNEEKVSRGLWKILVKRVMDIHMKKYSFNKLYGLWTRLRTSATIHAKDGYDPVDIIIWAILQKHNAEKSQSPRSPIKGKPRDTVSPTPLSPPAASMPSTSSVQKSFTEECTPKISNSDKGNNPKPSKKLKLSISPEKRNKTEPSIPSSTPSTPESCPSYQQLCQESSDKQSTDIRGQLFLLIKSAYKEMNKSGELNNAGQIWVKLLTKIYDNGFQGMKKEDAQAMWVSMRASSIFEVSKGRANPLAHQVVNFLEKVKNNKHQSQQKNDTLPVKKKSPPTKKKPYEADSAYRPNNKSDLVPTTIKEVKQSVEEKMPRKASASLDVIYQVDMEDDEDQNNQSIKPSKQNHHQWWAEEKEYLLSIISEKLPVVHSHSFWAQIKEIYATKGYDRTPVAIRQQWQYMRKRVETKIAEKTPLNDIEKKVEDIIREMKNIGREPVKVSAINETSYSYVSQNDIMGPPADVIKKEVIVPSPVVKESNSCIDLTSYDYVSLEDIQHSTSWDMPELQPMIGDEPNMKFVVSKVEGGVNDEADQGTSSRNVETEDGEDSVDAVIDDQGYVGAKDLIGVIDLLDSDEE